MTTNSLRTTRTVTIEAGYAVVMVESRLKAGQFLKVGTVRQDAATSYRTNNWQARDLSGRRIGQSSPTRGDAVAELARVYAR